MSIADAAEAWRDEGGLRRQWSFSVVKFIQQVLAFSQPFSGFQLEVASSTKCSESPAFVSFDPLKLTIHKSIWTQAQLREHHGYGNARHIIAHEIGHLVLHRDQTKSFSPIGAVGKKFYDDEGSSEWQANTFARYFLLPDRFVRELQSVDVIATLCHVPVELAEEAVSQVFG